MQALKRFMFLFLATILSVASTSFAFSANNLKTEVSAQASLSENLQDQNDLHFNFQQNNDSDLLDAIVDFEEEEDEGKKKFLTFFVGTLEPTCTPVHQDVFQKKWIGQRINCLQSQSIRLHLLIRKIQV